MNITGFFLKITRKTASPEAGKIIQSIKLKAVDCDLGALRKEARNTLRKSGLWSPEFNDVEVSAAIASLHCAMDLLEKKNAAIDKAIEFIKEAGDYSFLSSSAADTMREIDGLLKKGA